MLSQEQMQNLSGTAVYDQSKDKIGKVGAVYADDRTGEPSWISVNTGLFGTNESFVPAQGAELDGENLVVAYDKQQVKDAPNVDEDGHLSVEQEQQLFRHYGLDYGNDESTGYTTGETTGRTTGERTDYATGERADYATDERVGTVGGVRDDETATAGSVSGRHTLADDAAVAEDRRVDRDDTVGHDTSGPNTDDAMTISEERLRVGTERVEAGRARLRKYVVTENVSQTVPVSHEEVRIEREPITDANRDEAYSGAAISEEEHEVVLHAERPVVDKTVEAVERVRLNTETVRGEETVSDEVRKERVDTDGIETTGTTTGTTRGATVDDTVDDTTAAERSGGEYRR